jgi:hypothetical protein
VTEIVMRKVLARDLPALTPVLAAVDEAASQDLAHVPGAQDVLVNAKMKRSPAQLVHLRKMWALAQKLSEACDALHDKDEAMEFMLIGCKHVRWITNPTTGNVWPMAKSISELDGDQFDRLYKRALYFICTEVVPRLDESALRAEIEQMVAPRIWEPA